MGLIYSSLRIWQRIINDFIIMACRVSRVKASSLVILSLASLAAVSLLAADDGAYP